MMGPDADSSSAPPSLRQPPSGSSGGGGGFKKLLMPLGAVGLILWKLKAVLFGALKFLPMLLKTGGTMLLTIWLYALGWGWQFALGFVVLIFIHECGHLLAARRLGLKVGAPVFIPFMGAIIALKEAPRNAWVEAQVGIGGPLLGSLGAVASFALGWLTHNPLFIALAHTGFFLNLFNLAPIGFLDGGRVVTALSPWLWLAGAVIMGLLLFAQFNFLILLILLMSLPRLFSLFRRKSEEERRYFEVTTAQRWIMAAMYFGLAAFLALAMQESRVAVPGQ
jgi:Zn-dependent protease